MTIVVSQSKIGPVSKPRQSLWGWISGILAVRRQRRALLTLDTHMLNDIGVTQSDAVAEADKPVWDVPTYWSK